MTVSRLGLSFSWREKSLEDIVSCCRVAEEAGLESVWISEAWGRDAFVALSAIANATREIRLATGIVNVFSRSPAAIAMGAATLEELSKGRTILGLGSSGRLVVDRWHGEHFEKPFTRLRESVTVIRQILTGSQANYQGRIFHVSNFCLAVQSPTRQIPIYLAALGPKMLRLTGEIADGVLLYLCPLSKIREAIAEIQQGVERAKRSLTGLDIAAFLPTFVSEKTEQARLAVAKVIAYYVGGMGTYYHRLVSESGFQIEADNICTAWQRGDRVTATKAVTPQLIDTVALAGSPQECRTRLEEFRRAGVSLPILSLSVEDQNSRQVAINSIKILAAE